MATISQVSICNRALSLLGADRITSLEEDSVEARQCNAFYDISLESILSEHPWTFAQKRALLATVSETLAFEDDTMSVVYQKPSDLIKVNFVNVATAIFKVEGDRILSNTASLAIKYTFRNNNPQSYYPHFVTAFSHLLAAEMAFSITNSRSIVSDLNEIYENIKLPKAMASDSQQSTPVMPSQDDWLSGRISGPGGALGGSVAWVPVSTT